MLQTPTPPPARQRRDAGRMAAVVVGRRHGPGGRIDTLCGAAEMTDGRRYRIGRHVGRHKRKYVAAIAIGSFLMMGGDFVIGVIGNLVASIVGPVVGIH